MPYANSFIRVTQTFQLPGSEVANTSTSWNPSSPLVSLDDATADAFFDRSADWWTAIRTEFTDEVKWTGCRVAWVGTDGSVLSVLDRLASPNNGTATGNPLPNEVSVVLSLRAATNTRTTRGRMYLPPLAVSALTGEGRFDSAICESLGDDTAIMLADVTVGAETFTSVVASATAGTMASILNVLVGNVPDAQRRRRDALIESYTTSPV